MEKFLKAEVKSLREDITCLREVIRELIEEKEELEYNNSLNGKEIEKLKEENEELKENKSDLEYCLESLKKAISLGEKGWVKGGELYDLYVLPLKEENEKLKEELDVLSLA
jgi:FtsZ-binding cell division protein ZapB